LEAVGTLFQIQQSKRRAAADERRLEIAEESLELRRQSEERQAKGQRAQELSNSVELLGNSKGGRAALSELITLWGGDPEKINVPIDDAIKVAVDAKKKVAKCVNELANAGPAGQAQCEQNIQEIAINALQEIGTIPFPEERKMLRGQIEEGLETLELTRRASARGRLEIGTEVLKTRGRELEKEPGRARRAAERRETALIRSESAEARTATAGTRGGKAAARKLDAIMTAKRAIRQEREEREAPKRAPRTRVETEIAGPPEPGSLEARQNQALNKADKNLAQTKRDFPGLSDTEAAQATMLQDPELEPLSFALPSVDDPDFSSVLDQNIADMGELARAGMIKAEAAIRQIIIQLQKAGADVSPNPNTGQLMINDPALRDAVGDGMRRELAGRL
jgi:hypothetical protein